MSIKNTGTKSQNKSYTNVKIDFKAIGKYIDLSVTITWILSLNHYNKSETINNLIMKKILSILTLSIITFANTAFAEDPIIQPLQIEPLNTAQFEMMQFETLPLQPDDPEYPYTDDPNLVVDLDFELLDDGRPSLTWSKYNGPNFLYYKVLHDQDDPNLIYPEFGYIAYFEDKNINHYVWDEPLPVGENFMRVCVITTDDRRGCSNSISHFMPQAFYENLDREREAMLREEPEPENDRLLNDEQREKLQDLKENLTQNNFRIGKWLSDNLGIILAVIGVIIAATGFTFATRRKQKSISKYMNQIDDTYTEYKMKAKRCEAELYRLKDMVDDELKTGKIDDGAYQVLINRIENYMVDIQKQIVNEKFGGLPASLKDEMFKMMEDGEITESEMETMQKLIKRSELSINEQDSLLAQIRDFKKQDEAMKKKGKS